MLVSTFVSGLVWLSVTSALPAPNYGQTCDCGGTKEGGSDPQTYVCRDERLGPRQLPTEAPLSTITAGYERFGGLTAAQFLTIWTNTDGSWKWPPKDGFQLDTHGNPINSTTVLVPGTLLDRFGGENGKYVSAAGAPYSQRALPPVNLSKNKYSTSEYPYNYHVYQVLKDLTVVAGPIAPWFNQPGLGAQFYTGDTGNIESLVNQGFLLRVNSSILVTGKGGCF